MKLISLLCILFVSTVHGQTKSNNIKSLVDAAEQLKCDSIPFVDLNNIVNSSKKNIQFTTNSRFGLIAKYDFEYKEVFGSLPNTKSSDTLAVCLDNTANTYTEPHLLSTFDCSTTLKIASTKEIPSSLFYERGADGNSVWSAYQVNDFLIIRYVHNYPNGNMTTFSKETRFYFRANKND